MEASLINSVCKKENLAFAFLVEEKLMGRSLVQALIFFGSFLVSRQEMNIHFLLTNRTSNIFAYYQY